MKQVQISAYGVPEVVAHCVELEDVGAPDIGEVVFDVLAFPINPADIMFCRGTYRLRPPLPATPGAECVGRVVATGAGVTIVNTRLPSGETCDMNATRFEANWCCPVGFQLTMSSLRMVICGRIGTSAYSPLSLRGPSISMPMVFPSSENSMPTG